MIVRDEQLLGRALEHEIAKWYPGAVCCVICFALSDARANEIPARLRALFQPPWFDTQAKRMGTAIRIAEQGVSYYTFKRKTVATVEI